MKHDKTCAVTLSLVFAAGCVYFINHTSRSRSQSLPHSSNRAPRAVWNLQVQGEPVYLVTKKRLKAHNVSAVESERESWLDWTRSVLLGKRNGDIERVAPAFWIPAVPPAGFVQRPKAPIETFSREQVNALPVDHIDFRNPADPRPIDIGPATLTENLKLHREEGMRWARAHGLMSETNGLSPSDISPRTARDFLDFVYSGDAKKTPRIYEFQFLKNLPRLSNDPSHSGDARKTPHTSGADLSGIYVHQAPLTVALGVKFLALKENPASASAMDGAAVAYHPDTNTIFVHRSNLASLPRQEASRQIAVAAFSARRSAYGLLSPLHVRGYPRGTDISDVFAWQIRIPRWQQFLNRLKQPFDRRERPPETPTTQGPSVAAPQEQPITD